MASGKALKNFTVTYRRKSGDMSTKTSPATGPDDASVRSDFEAKGYHVIAVVYEGFAR